MSTPAFDFVPVEPDAALMAEPGWHDGSQPGRLSGEIRCTLKAITPLLVGCHQIEVEDATEPVQQAFRKLVGSRANVPPQAVSLVNRKILQPLMAGSGEGHSPVLLPGTSLKGMLRHALGSLLSAPMERVNERRFTHRPNMQLSDGKTRKIVPAVVTELGPNGNIAGIRCVPYQGLQYRWDDPPYLASQALDRWNNVAGLPPAARKAAYTQPRPATEVCLQDGRAKWVLVRSHRGLDHEGELDRAFIGQNPNEGNRRPLPEFIGIPLSDSGDWISVDIEDPQESQRLRKRVRIPANEIPTRLPADVFEAYLRTQKTLGDEAFGHFRDHPLVNQAGINGERLVAIRNRILHPEFQIGDLVFLEFNSVSKKIVAMGHHLRYRWGTTDSVQRVGYLTRGQEQAELRKEIRPRADEVAADAPKALSAARLLFGYAAPGGKHDKPDWPTSHGIGFKDGKETDHGKLAGRIAINHAVELVRPGSGRFLNPGESFMVPLRAQGSPKPSFARDYLNQKPDNNDGQSGASALRTWGDALDIKGAPLAGRKHYWHQGDSPTFELRNSQSPDWMVGTKKAIETQFSVVARHVSAPGTEFRFTLRFRDLSPRELGALLFALCPETESVDFVTAALRQRVDGLTDIARKKILSGHRLLSANWQGAVFGHKLGHGRPLGMGSVSLSIDALALCRPAAPEPLSGEEMTQLRSGWRQAFSDWIATTPDAHLGKVMEVLYRWLDLRRRDGRTPRRHRDLKEAMRIWQDHSKQRKI